jgi:DinB superfamily
MQAEQAPDIQPATSLLEKTPFLLETMLHDTTPLETSPAMQARSSSKPMLPDDLLHWKPTPERWSISEVLAHLVEIEELYAGRVRRMAAEDAPKFLRYVQPDPASPNAGSQGDTAKILARFTSLRRDNVAFLNTMPADAGARTGHHSELGPITLSQMLCEWASHDLGHLRQIAELYRARAFYPYAGPFQKYSNPKP